MKLLAFFALFGFSSVALSNDHSIIKKPKTAEHPSNGHSIIKKPK